MGNDTYGYDAAVATDAEGRLGQIAAALESQIKDLTTFVNGVCSTWDGDEKELYRGIQAQWNTAAGNVSEILTSIKTVLGSTTTSVGEMRGQVRRTLQA